MKIKNISVIAKKELRSYFDNPTAYIVLVAFLLLWDFLFFRNAFLVGEASLRGLFSLLPWLFLLLIPAITMGSISQEKREGTLEFLLTHPLRDIEFILGKFLGSFIFAAVALIFVVPIAWSFAQYGNFDWGVLSGQYLAGLFMAATIIALGIFISGIFISQVSALLVTVLVSFFLIVTGFGMVADRLPLAIAPLLEQLSVINHFDAMARGVIDFRDVWYFVSVTVAFLSLAYLGLVKRRFGNNKKKYKSYQLGIALFVGITILTNAVSARIPGRLDLTQNNIYTLSAQTREIVGGLDDVVNIDFFASGKLPAQLQPTLRDAQDILRDYKSLGKGNLVVNQKDPSSDAEAAEAATALGIREIQFNVISQEELQVKNGYLGLAVSYGGESEAIPFIESTEELEYQLTSFIKKLTVKEKKKIGFLSGHGEKTSAELGTLKKELQKQYEIEDISPTGDEEAGNPAIADPKKAAVRELVIPEDLDALVIAGPSQEISAAERKVIAEFVQKGKAALFLIDAITVTPQMMTAAENPHSLADFVKENYGVEVQKDMVYDVRANETVNFGSFFLPYPLWVKAVVSGAGLPELAKVGNVNLPWSSSLTVDSEKAKTAGFAVKNLLETTKFGGTQTGVLSIKPDQSFSQENLKKQIVAVSLEAEKVEENKARMIIVGDSDFMTDQFVTNSPGNFAFAAEALSWLAQEESVAKIKIKSREERKLLFEDQAQANAVKFGNMGLAFLVPLIVGTWRIARRRKMQKESYKN